MGKQIRQIKWDSFALNSFLNILEFIKLDSPSNAKTIKNRILNLVSDIPKNPEIYRIDELKKENDGSFRVLNKDSIRISYKIEDSAIIIARIVHSSQMPKTY